jgi:glucose-1-phosphate thymidylyltransferase
MRPIINRGDDEACPCMLLRTIRDKCYIILAYFQHPAFLLKLGGRVHMKGVVLAGGLGTRLHPLTKVTNKHLLPIYNKPMIYYPIELMVDAGIRDILIVTGGKNAGDFLRLLGNGREFGLEHINYAYQEGEGGIAAALSLAEFFADRHPICVILGDNIVQGSISRYVANFNGQASGARILLKEVPDPQRFGVPEIRGSQIVRIDEKPEHPASQYAVTGIYMYDPEVFEIVKTLKPSRRGELEITDVNNCYIDKGKMQYDILDGWWTDAGTFESLLHASNLVCQTVEKAKAKPTATTQQAG